MLRVRYACFTQINRYSANPAPPTTMTMLWIIDEIQNVNSPMVPKDSFMGLPVMSEMISKVPNEPKVMIWITLLN